MPRGFYKHKLLLDENMPSRHYFPRLNHLFDVKHIAVDLKKGSIKDELVYEEAVKLHRLVVTFNGDDFKPLAYHLNNAGRAKATNWWNAWGSEAQGGKDQQEHED